MEKLEQIKLYIESQIEQNIDKAQKPTDLHDLVVEIVEKKARRETITHKEAIEIMAELKLYNWAHFEHLPTDVTAVAFKGLQETLESDFRRFYTKALAAYARKPKTA